MKKEKYISYLLRAWLVRVSGISVWRGSLEDPFTGERMGFANLLELFIYLSTKTGEKGQDTDEMSG
jgi:hypothetical protein